MDHIDIDVAEHEDEIYMRGLRDGRSERPEDVLKQTPENLNGSGDVKENLQDAPRPDKASQGSTVSGGERPEQAEDAPPPTDAAPVASGKPFLTVYDAEYLRGLSVGGSHLVSAKWLCDFAKRIKNTLATHPEDAPCPTCAEVRRLLRGHPDSQLVGEEGLAAATMRDVDRLTECWLRSSSEAAP